MKFVFGLEKGVVPQLPEAVACFIINKNGAEIEIVLPVLPPVASSAALA